MNKNFACCSFLAYGLKYPCSVVNSKYNENEKNLIIKNVISCACSIYWDLGSLCIVLRYANFTHRNGWNPMLRSKINLFICRNTFVCQNGKKHGLFCIGVYT